MADDFQSQPKCPLCKDAGIYTKFKYDPIHEEDEYCSCGAMTEQQFLEHSRASMRNLTAPKEFFAEFHEILSAIKLNNDLSRGNE